MSSILVVKNLNKKVELTKNNVLHILKNVNIEIEKGEFVSIMGPSGSGKSTLLYNISGMDKITSGSVIFKGHEIGNLGEEDLAKIRLNDMGFIFQDINLLKNLSILDNVIFPAFALNAVDKNIIKKKAEKLLEMTGISSLADNNIIQASGGQLQRVGICRALINDPDIIFGDEPTGALDSKSATEIMSILSDINKSGTTILLVTHDAKVAAQTERVLFMVDGNIVEQKRMNKYDEKQNDLKQRTEYVMKWLIHNGI